MSESRFVKDKNNLSINSHCNCGLCRRAVYRPEIPIVESSERVKRLFVHILCLPIRFYQVFISPLFPPCCRYYPTCSSYALEAIKKHGPLKGTFMATKRILRCNPFHEGGYDPVP